MSNSILLKAIVDENGIIKNLTSFQIEKNTSDPKSNSLNDSPEILKVISVPDNGFGPHYVGEYGNELWVSLKKSHDVLRINHDNISDYNVYNGFPNPIFIGRHPITNMFYASQDDSSYIMKINPQNDEIKQIKISPNIGETPVGLISGPNGIWFTLLGNSTNGTGTIGYIDPDDNIFWFKLKTSLGSNASLLHLAFDVDYIDNHNLWLLSSSIINDNALDMVIKLKFDSQWKNMISEEITVVPTQKCQVSTPTSIVDFMLDAVGYKGENVLSKHILDNSCGDGAFLKSIVKRYVEVAKEKKLSPTEIKKGLETYIHGVEIESNSYEKCLKNLNSIFPANYDIRLADALLIKDYDKKMDFVVGNPPYVKIHNLNGQTKNIISQQQLKGMQVFPDITTYPVISLFANSQTSQKFNYSVVELKNNGEEQVNLLSTTELD
ncbi:9726_t:CDS:2 [Ambispora gerdemannii]|uniref:9726_t:CDS:1 n=1 Tax=Ambispora gerdemannii TaxID=144530 RepID=A0A9N8ZRK7_9GLOM|nr:9726_t:CDS:2 [Ambispora gerdemannii]